MKEGDFIVFELKDDNLKQLSIVLRSLEEANSFIKTMKEGMYYKSMRPDIVLITLEVKTVTV